MRLSKIKLSGFKSFVDPTTIPLPSSLIGIVGPNGCGKSNVIDAVRWVMGESSAKHLRGDSMADVVFNGSSSRKPVGQATVELVFDNSEGSLGGQYANYNEIAIKRTVSRDGVSNYYLNGTRCRRRDITDIFLGTGLGPRSYAIIEQGTISRLIEAKPEELRVFIEEAAGISKYKERRRETENRIRHTRENLDRLNDLREEVEKQIAHLQRQARTAERYKVLKEEERITRAQLQALRWKSLNEQSRETETTIRDLETALEAETARQRSIEAEIEKHRDMHTEATDAFNEVQSRFYSIGADIARLEQSIQHAKERRQQQQNDLEQLERDWSGVQQQLDFDKNKIEEIRQALESVEPQLVELEECEKQSGEKLAEAERAMHDWQSEWETFNQQSAKPVQTAEVERTRIEHLEQQLAQLQQRLQALGKELAEQSPEALHTQIEQLEAEHEQAERAISEYQDTLNGEQRGIVECRDSIRELNNQLSDARDELQELQSHRASLEALQRAALGKQEGAITDWLKHRQLENAPRLAEKLQVEPGWEKAAECVLGFNLEAVCVEDVDPLTEFLASVDGGSLTLIDTRQASSSSEAHGEKLTQKVSAPWSLENLLGDVYIAEDLQAALGFRSRLGAHESVVTRDGIWIGKGWLRLVRDKDEHGGILEREQELKELVQSVDEKNTELEELNKQLENTQERLHDLEHRRDDTQQQLNQANRRHAELQSQLSSRKSSLEQLRSRQQALQNEKDEATGRLESSSGEISEARQRLQSALDEIAGYEQQRKSLQDQRNALRNELDAIRQKANSDRNAAHEIKVRVETLRTEHASFSQALERLQQQSQQLTSRRDELRQQFDASEAPLNEMNTELEVGLESRMKIESELSEARKKLENVDFEMRELEEQRGSVEQSAQEIRGKLESMRIGWQEFKVRRQTLEENIAEAGFQLQALIEELPGDAEENRWAENLQELERKIQRLGAINLAAIEEFEQQSERKVYLDAQNADLTEALTTLENAIRKIDKETRTRFKETFDQINTGIQALFPRLFGGGHAYLELTGEELLDAGVTVMARPPGKRNSTIHLLSGGEKALTAVALVFSIFELNPAPFCMLDEVDAPLDDANVGRYSDMLKEMSDRTQFIFISHNKITMEIAHQLNGVTMNEPGVSHLVAVDVDQAVEMAAV